MPLTTAALGELLSPIPKGEPFAARRQLKTVAYSNAR
jgi:hypothetical protein